MENITQQSEAVLYHHGILGMKWGVRRFQNKDGSLTSAGKKRYGDGDGDSSSGNSGQSKKKKFSISKKSGGKDTEEKTKEEQTKEEYEAAKQQALKSGSAKEVLKYKGDLTQQEMQSAMSRIKWEQEMQNISSKEVTDGKAKADAFFGKVDDVTGYATTTIKAYNTVANVYNAFNKDGKLLPTVSTNNTSDNRIARKRETKEKEKEQTNNQQTKPDNDSQQTTSTTKTNMKDTSTDNNQQTTSTAKTNKKDTSTDNNQQTTSTTKTESTKKESWKGEVEGVGTSSRSNSSSKEKSKPDDYYDPIDIDEWIKNNSSTSMSDISDSTVSSGKSKVEQYLLEDQSKYIEKN